MTHEKKSQVSSNTSNLSDMRYFDNGTKVSMDPCAVEAREHDNVSIANYKTFNASNPTTDRRACDAKRQELATIMGDNPNLRYHEGVGGAALPCFIDDDTKLRMMGEWTSARERNQMFLRFFHAVPDLSRGTLIPNMESFLKNGIDTTYERQCNRLSEVDFQRAQAFDTCAAQRFGSRAESTPDWGMQFGKSSREEVRSKEFLQDIGYTHNGRFWEKNTCA